MGNMLEYPVGFYKGCSVIDNNIRYKCVYCQNYKTNNGQLGYYDPQNRVRIEGTSKVRAYVNSLGFTSFGILKKFNKPNGVDTSNRIILPNHLLP